MAEVVQPTLSNTPTTLDTKPVSKTSMNWLFRHPTLLALLLYTVATVVVFWPTLTNINTTVVGFDNNGDNSWGAWLLWWFKQAVESGQDPARTHLAFGLLPSADVFMVSFYNEALGFLLQLFLSPVGTFNLLVISSFILSGLTFYLLAAEFIPNKIACFAAGFIYSFSTFHFTHAEQHIEEVTIQWLPFFAWRLFVFYRKPNLKNSTWLGVAFALVIFSALYYVAYFVFPFVVLFVIGKLLTDRKWFFQIRNLLLSVFAVVVGLAVSIVPSWDYFISSPEIAETIKRQTLSGISVFAIDPLDFFFPSPANPVFGRITLLANLQIPFEGYVFLGYFGIVLSLYAFVFKQNRRPITFFWLVLVVTGIVLAGGSTIRLPLTFNQSTINLSPYNLFFSLPFLQSFRDPSRLGVLVIFSVAMLSAFAINAIFLQLQESKKSSFNPKLAQVVLTGLLLALQFSGSFIVAFPNPTTPILVPAVYQQIAADSSNSLVLELPAFPFSLYEYYQTVHHHPQVGGYLSRTLPSQIDSLDEIPYLYNVAASTVPDGSDSSKLATDIYPFSFSFVQALAERNIKYVLLHDKISLGYFSEQDYKRAYTFLAAQLGQPFYQNSLEDVVAWKIPATLPDPAVTRIELGSGWVPGLHLNQDGNPARNVEQDAQVFIYAPSHQTYNLTFTAQADFRPQTMQISLNSQLVQTVNFSSINQLQKMELNLELQPGQNIVSIHSAQGCFVDSSQLTQVYPTCSSFTVEKIGG